MLKLFLYSLFLVSILSAIPLTSKAGNLPDLRKWGAAWEEFDSSLFYRIQSIDDIISYADSIQGKGNRQTLAYGDILASTIKRRFYHGYSYYSIQENWLAWMAGVTIWNHLHAIVLPDDILKHPGAACSQQAIVLKECFKRAGIDYREVNLKGHFVLEGKVEGEWILFDTNLEPRFPKGRKSLEALLRSGEIVPAYSHALTPIQVAKVFAHPVYRSINAQIAPNATLFQQVTGFLSFSLPLMLPLGLLMFLFTKMRAKKDRKPEGVKFVVIRENVEEVERRG